MAFSANAENFSLSSDVIRRVSKELKELIEEPLESISILVNDKDITDVQCIVEGPAGTPYAGGHFRVKLSMPKDFPHSPPRGYFLTRIFHPNVAPTSGEICVNTLKKRLETGIRNSARSFDGQMFVDCTERGIGVERGGREIIIRTIRRVRQTSEDDDRNSRSSAERSRIVIGI